MRHRRVTQGAVFQCSAGHNEGTFNTEPLSPCIDFAPEARKQKKTGEDKSLEPGSS